MKQNCYVGYPLWDSVIPDVNIIFIHGLLGHSHKSWRCNDSMRDEDNKAVYSRCWPIEWLPNSLLKKDLTPRVILMSYPTALSTYSTHSNENEYELEKQATILRENIQALDLSGPTIMIGHSMGGLLWKQIIVHAFESGDHKFLSNISGLCFYSTPHHGCTLAKYGSMFPMLNKVLGMTKDIRQLSSSSDYPVRLHQAFTDVIVKYPNLRNMISFIETQPTKFAFGQGYFIIICIKIYVVNRNGCRRRNRCEYWIWGNYRSEWNPSKRNQAHVTIWSTLHKTHCLHFWFYFEFKTLTS